MSAERGAYASWRRGHRLLVGAYILTVFHVARWLWEHDWKPIALLGLMHIWGWFTMLIGVWSVPVSADSEPSS